MVGIWCVYGNAVGTVGAQVSILYNGDNFPTVGSELAVVILHRESYLCSTVPMFHRAYDPPCLCSTVAMFHRAYVPPCLCSTVSLFHRVFVPPCTKKLYAHRLYVPPCFHSHHRRLYVPLYLCSNTGGSKVTLTETGHGDPHRRQSYTCTLFKPVCFVFLAFHLQ